ncbi:hypothetical protein LCI18_008536 [Fusarium solani-melongenae]|uniref:Uncharacterized protein n=1 Tax=Fusarium solani subsp. cucurbitae TaxID=2747967 RepID=A0ACD3Z8S3_FUSSC|nr:hypothetical protein LCI18_008536 [Fusarium solani-melongenae]
MEIPDQPSNKTGNDSTQAIPILFHEFSVHSPYLITCGPGPNDPTTPDITRYRQEGPGQDSRYLTTISPPWQSLSEEMQHSIRKELKILFFEETANELRSMDTYAIRWCQILDIPLVKWRHPGKVDIKPEAIIEFLNKEVMMYIDQESIYCGAYGMISRYIYRKWLHLYNGRPPFQRDSFFAIAARCQDEGPNGLGRLSKYHKDLSQMLSAHLDDCVDFYPYGTRSQTITPPHFQPIPDRAIQSFRDHKYLIRPLFRALYIFVDGQALAEYPGPFPTRRGEGEYLLDYRQRLLVQMISRVTVLLVKTGDESHLFSSISFLPLFDYGLALDVNRPDYEDGIEPAVVRVKLDAAILFVWELLNKEEAAGKEASKEAKRRREELEAFCEAWVNRVVAHSQEVGTDTNGYSWLAIRRALAKKNSEAFDDDQVNPWWESLRHWTAL